MRYSKGFVEFESDVINKLTCIYVCSCELDKHSPLMGILAATNCFALLMSITIDHVQFYGIDPILFLYRKLFLLLFKQLWICFPNQSLFDSINVKFESCRRDAPAHRAFSLFFEEIREALHAECMLAW